MPLPADIPPSSNAPGRHWSAWLLGVASVGIISLPLLGSLWKRSSAASGEDVKKYELREAAAWPSRPADAASWEAYPKAVEAYVNDHLELRGLLVGIHNRLKLHLGIAPNEVAAIGKDGWLFFRPQEWEDVRGLATRSFMEKAGCCAFLNRIHDSLEKEGVPFLFVVAPDKSSIYPEELPSNVQGGMHKHRLDDLLAFLKKHGCRAHILDLRPVLLAAKNQGQLFHKQDTHWNDFGAALAAHEILSRLNTLGVPVQARPVSPDDFTLAPARSLDLSGVLHEDRIEMAPFWKRELTSKIETDFAAPELLTLYPNPLFPEYRFVTRFPAGKGRLLMFRDSFATALTPVLSTSFAWVGYLWRGPNEDMAGNVRDLKPTAVLWETVERYAGLFPAQTGADAVELYSQFLDGVPLDWSRDWTHSLGASREVASFTNNSKKIQLITTGGNAQITLENHLTLQKGYKVLGCRVRSPAATTFVVSGKSSDRSSGNIGLQVPLREGWNWVLQPLPEEAFRGTLSIRPGTVAGDYEIRDLIIREE